MAARENQGLQIALIIFVMLTIILSVTTFIFFNNYKEQSTAAETAKKSAGDAGNREREAQGERNLLLTKLGFPETETREKIEQRTAEEIKKHADFFSLRLPDDQQNYTRLVEELAKTAEAKSKELLAAKQANDELNKQLKDAQAAWDAAKKELTDDKAKLVASEQKNRSDYTTQVAEVTKTKDQAVGIIAQKDQALQKLKSDTDSEVKKARDELAQARATIEFQKDLIQKLTQARPTVPDGRILWVDQRNNSVFINVGRDDGLQRRVTFTVFDPDATDATKAVNKGSIEVVDVRGPHLAEARILETTNTDPIVSGDIIYTPIWHPGQTQHFAIAGFIDFDHDGTNDRAKLRDIIRYNGGMIDAEAEGSNLTGRLSNRTQYLILGDPPSERAPEPEMKAFTAIGRDAQTNGVPTIKVDAFLAQIGYSVRPSTSTGDNNSGPRSIRPPSDIPDRTKTSGEGFRARRPPETKKSGSAD
jgi:hypothetical protein